MGLPPLSDCLHAFREHARRAVLYCEHCGEVRALVAESKPAPTTTRRNPARREAHSPSPPPAPSPQLTLPLDAPVAFGSGRSMFETPDAAPPSAEELDRMFDTEPSGRPSAERVAEELAELSARMRLKGVPKGADPPGTYRVEDTSAVERMT